ncbi:MAG TPA: hypothetical protein VLL30_23915 [Reyranella sp.]|nr:hypothetical protein [Reyranella sp.]
MRDATVGDRASTLHRLDELGMFLQPVVDRAVANLEGVGEVAVGGTRQAKLESLLGEFRLVERRPPASIHDRSSR